MVMTQTRKRNRDKYHVGVLSKMTYYSTPLTDFSKLKNKLLDDYYYPRAELKRFLTVDKGRFFNRLVGI